MDRVALAQLRAEMSGATYSSTTVSEKLLALAGARIKAERIERRWTVTEAAAIAEVSPKTWTNVEAGHAVRDLTRYAISLALGWKADGVDQLLAGNEPEPGRADRRSGQDRRSGHLLSDLTEQEQLMARAFIDGVRKFRAEHPAEDTPSPDGLDWLRGRRARRSTE